MSEETLRIVQVTGVGRTVAEPKWLSAAERVHRQLRPQLPAAYAEKMQQVFDGGGEMCVAVRADRVVGVAVFREFENTHVGRRFYIDDLVTDESERSTGAGRTLIAHLEKVARDRGCPGIDLESGTHRTRAHRFYFREGFFITAFSFRKEYR
ncbi:MAG TPA: GNAT family N-acetyltransferase [Burkholderiales bacterium]|nr:GNAT family N-acetyltransferase [Burkholderiales bacterium]